MLNYQEFKDQDNQRTENGQTGDNFEQAQLSHQGYQDAETRGWDNNKPGITTDNNNNQQVPNAQPGNENRFSGSNSMAYDNRESGDMDPQNVAYSPDKDGSDDEDLVEGEDDDFLDDDEDDTEELIPIETEDDDDDLSLDDDDDDLEDDDDLDPLEDRPTTFQVDADFASRDHGRVTGTMTDHEPGLPGSGEKRDYNL